MGWIAALAIALVQLAGVYFFATRAITRLNRACSFGAGTGRFYLQLAGGGFYALLSMALFFSIPFVWRLLR